MTGTKVFTSNGAVDIEKLSRGDQVWSIDPVHHKLVAVAVFAMRKHVVETVLRIRFSNGSVLKVSPEHPFWDPAIGQYREIGKFRAGERVSYLSGWDGGNLNGTVEELTITSIETLPRESTSVYNMHVDGPFNNYLAGGVIVHNK